jgi:hypothetical protein
MVEITEEALMFASLVHTGPMGFYAITVFFIPIAAGIGTPIVKPK